MVDIENNVTESCSPNLIFKQENYFQEYSMNIWVRKFTPNFENGKRFTALTQRVSQDLKNIL